MISWVSSDCLMMRKAHSGGPAKGKAVEFMVGRCYSTLSPSPTSRERKHSSRPVDEFPNGFRVNSHLQILSPVSVVDCYANLAGTFGAA